MSFARKSPLRRGGRLTASRWGVYSVKRDNWRRDFLGERDDKPEKLTAYEKATRRFVQQLPCCVCGKRAPSEASHVALSPDQKGVSMKVPHSQVVPKCRPCHGEWEERRGRFVGWSRERRWEQASAWVEAVHALMTPGDSRDDALALEAAGLGRVIGNGGGGWSWLPGSWSDVGAAGLSAAGERLIGAAS
jgi:hypothetical protein